MTNKLSFIKERILHIAECHNIAKSKFCKEIGLTYGNFTGNNKKTPLNSTAIGNILSIVPDLNLEWLITGQGEMLKETVHRDQNCAGVSIDKYNQLTEENEAFKQQIIQLQQDKQNLEQDKQNQQVLINLFKKKAERAQQQHQEAECITILHRNVWKINNMCI